MVGTIIDITERKRAERDLNERMKELTCLYGIHELTFKLGTNLDKMLEEAVDILPPGLQYPKITCARITIDSKEYKTGNFSETKWRLASNIVVGGEKVGTIEVFYLEEIPEFHKGPFLKEERNLLDGIATVLSETVEKKRAEEALRESEEKYRGLVEDSHVGIAVMDLEGKFTFVNQALCEMTGYSKEESLGRYFIDFVHPEDREEILSLFRGGIAAPNGAINLEYRVIHKKGHVVYMTASPMPLKEGDKLAGVIALITDITQVKRQEELIQELAEITRQEQAEIGGESALSVASGRPLTPLQKKFIKSGLEGFDDREAMKLLMSICNCGRQKAVTRQCFKIFANIREVLSASEEELEQAGFAPQCIFYLKLLREIPREVLRERIRGRAVYESSKEVFDYLYYSMRDLKEELFKVIYLDSREGTIDIVDLFEGEAGSIYIQPREIVETAIKRKAASLLFVHNHPSGNPKPGKLDKKFTRDLVFVGNILQIRVLDHIIIGEDRYFSFADEGLIQQYEDDFLNVRVRRI